MTYYPNFTRAITAARVTLETTGIEVDPGRWQGVPTVGRPDLVTQEITNWRADVPVARKTMMGKPRTYTLLEQLADEIQPNLPWADDHFEERVSRVPSNPGEQYKNWPWWKGQERPTQSPGLPVTSSDDFRFTHTYQERFWPKQADLYVPGYEGREVRHGIRYKYGDLDDVVALLLREPYTRQATFPIFFPEDTGAVHGGRVPCTLHYHFLMRNNRLDLYYPMRSCDFVRHFRDDLYMACRLMLWVLDELRGDYKTFRHETDPPPWGQGKNDTRRLWNEVQPGYLYFTAYSLHYHKGDLHHVSPH